MCGWSGPGSVQLVWIFADSPPLQGRASHENPACEKLWGKHLVDLIPCFLVLAALLPAMGLFVPKV